MFEPDMLRQHDRLAAALVHHDALDPEGLAQILAVVAVYERAATDAAQRLLAEGYSYADLARVLGISRQRAHQLYTRPVTGTPASA